MLIHKTNEENSSISELVTLLAPIFGEGVEDIVPITSICIHPMQESIFVGKGDGTVILYSGLSGQRRSILYSHKKDLFVRKIALITSNVVVSEDASNTVRI